GLRRRLSAIELLYPQRHEDLRILALDQQCHVLARGLGLVLQLLHGLHALAIHAQDDVARLHASRSRRPGDLFHDEIALGVGLLFLLRIERTHREPELARLIGSPLVRPAARPRRLLLLLELGHTDPDVLLPAAAPDIQAGFAAGFHRGDGAGKLAEALDVLAIDGEDDIARLQTGLGRRSILLDGADERAARTIETERLGELRVHVLDRHADPAADDLSGLDELVLHVARHVDRNGEGDSHVAARA